MSRPVPAAGPSPFRTPEERVRDRAEKREAVLRAAVRMFNAHGFHATSLDDVASSLGISKPTIYHYLGNKEQVLIECVTRGLELLRAAAAQARQEPGNGLTRLRYFLLRYAQVIMDDYGRCIVRTGDEFLSAEGAALFRERKRDIDQAMRALIEEAIADRSVAPLDVRLTAFTLAGALNWPARWHSPDGPMSADSVAVSVVDILLSGLAPRP
ncbi:MAG: TetR/AcrR family transcriptional regulator [bacterium]|nr:TetR/AcrR family transcriptional regulator [bacterium]